jgi:hypothetical protein
LKQEKDESQEQLRVALYSLTAYKSEREEFREMLQEDKSQLQREKEEFLIEHTMVKEAVNKACCYVPGLAHEDQESVKVQVVKLAKTIQQIQERITELEAQVVSSTP